MKIHFLLHKFQFEIKSYISIIVILSFFSCKQIEHSKIEFTEFPETINKSTELRLFEGKVQYACTYTFDSILAAIDPWTERGFCIKYYNKTTMKYLGQTGRIGKAPDEIIRPMYPTIDRTGKRIFIVDEGRNRKIFEYSVEKSLKDTSYIPKAIFEIGMNCYYASDLTYCDNDLFSFKYSQTHEDSTEYLNSFIDLKQKKIDSYTELPLKKEIPTEAFYDFSMRNSCYRNGIIFTAFQYHDKIIAYDAENRKIIFEINGPDLIKPEVELRGDRWVPENTERVMTYTSVTASDEYVFGLYSGVSETINNYAPYSTNIIHVFDHTGNPVRKLILDRQVLQISYDDETNSLFGISGNETTMETNGIVWIELGSG
jgi:hypothetical protein